MNEQLSPALGYEHRWHPERRPTNEENANWARTAQVGLMAESYLKNRYGWEADTPIEKLDDPTEQAAVDELANIVSQGHEARNTMWEANLRLADYFIDEGPNTFRRFRYTRGHVIKLRRYVQEGLEVFPEVEMEDVRQWARLGLLKSIYNFDPERGAFAGAAFFRIRTSVQRGFAASRTIRLGYSSSHDTNPQSLRNAHADAIAHDFENGYSESLTNLQEHPTYVKTETVVNNWQPDVEGINLDEDYDERLLPLEQRALVPEADIAPTIVLSKT